MSVAAAAVDMAEMVEMVENMVAVVEVENQHCFKKKQQQLYKMEVTLL